VFAKYRGDIDGVQRCGTAIEKELLADGAFDLIADLVLRLSLVHSGAASASFTAETSKILQSTMVDPAAASLLNTLASTASV
jgi:hypothetical protein